MTAMTGSLDPGSTPLGGFSFYTPGPRLHDGTSQPLLDFKKGREITFSYSIFFEPGYAFNLGGKLPGLCEYYTTRSCTTLCLLIPLLP